MSDFISYINKRCRISESVANTVLENCIIRSFPKNSVLLKEGMVAHYLYFIEKGVARNFYVHDEKEITSWFYKEGQLLTSWNSFLQGSQPTK